MMSIILILIGAMLPVTAAPFLAHSKAVVAGQAGEHERAQKLLQEALVAAPRDAALLFDAGVAEFKCGNYAPAASYFEKAAQHAEKPALQQEALFNAGNAHAHLKEYDAALQNYEKILATDVTNERARHNYDVVKKLKEQEEQQQQNQDENQREQDQENQQDQEDQENKNNDQQEDNAGDDNKSDQSDDAQQQDQQQQQKQSGKDSGSSEKKQQQKQQGTDKQQKESPTHGDQSADTQERDYNKQQEESRNAHNKPSEKAEKKEQTQAQSSNSAKSAQPSQKPEQPQIPEALEGPDKQWMRCALEACDKQDTTHNKQLLKAVVGAEKGDRRAVRSSW